MNQWSREELEVLQQFFEIKVCCLIVWHFFVNGPLIRLQIACAPYKPNAFMTFHRILTVPLRILKDFIKIMKFELFPDRSLKWSVQFCLTMPPFSQSQAGMTALLIINNKILIFVRFCSK